MIIPIFKRKEVTYENMHDELSDQLNEVITERTIRRDVEKMQEINSFTIKKMGDLIRFGNNENGIN